MTQKYKSGVYNRELFWSAESRLDSATLDSWTMVKYAYNALGKPVIKYRRDPNSGWAVDSYFVWDGDQLLLDLDASGNRNSDYTYFPGTIDQPAMETIGATSVTAIREHRMDASGNVTGTVDGVAVSQKVSYDAWGTPTATGNWDNRLLWKGLMWDGDAVSLYYVRNRWYDPELGRFINEDPIGHAGGDNLYSFGGNEPVNASDPSGLMMPAVIVIAHWDPFIYMLLLEMQFGGGGGSPVLGSVGNGMESTPGRGGGGLSASRATAVARQIGRTMRPLNTAVNCAGSVAFTTAVAVSDAKILSSVVKGGLAELASHSTRVKAGDIALRHTTGGNYATSGYLSLLTAHADATATTAAHAFAHAGVEYGQGLRATLGGIFTSREASGWDFAPGVGFIRSGFQTARVCSGE